MSDAELAAVLMEDPELAALIMEQVGKKEGEPESQPPTLDSGTGRAVGDTKH